MSSEWLRVMLEEIARKKAEALQESAEAQRRQATLGTTAKPSAPVAGGAVIP